MNTQESGDVRNFRKTSFVNISEGPPSGLCVEELKSENIVPKSRAEEQKTSARTFMLHGKEEISDSESKDEDDYLDSTASDSEESNVCFNFSCIQQSNNRQQRVLSLQ
eukprot:TRINITY_DN4262_c0_g1_i1.p1 TRINITY_DN4262_c0_g1~~TRINITY_DN4262_c0_g1_i1.p1  ORF type:complete len:108 (-),score=1.63 TRINITY_DN4262_c0_g1_i1:538-861(-)